MRRGGRPFFALLNAVFPGDGIIGDGGIPGRRSILDDEKENEWMQEYYIIYNSYILDNKEAEGLNE